MPKRTGYKLLGGSLTCPPGFFCMDFSTICFGILIALMVVGTIVFVFKSQKEHGGMEHREMHHANMEQPAQKPTVIVVQAPSQQAPAQQAQTNPDPRFSPLAPEQSYETQPDIRGFPSPPVAAGLGPIMPINTQTRGYPDTFQQIGLLTTAGGSETSASPTRTILPLFGRKLITNRDRWNYYTRTDGINPVQVPVQYKRRNCEDDNGCDEIMEGESVSVPIMGQSYIANIYRYSTPRYIPIV